MFKLIVICALLCTISAQQHEHEHHGDEVHAEITHYDSDVHDHGFRYGYETSNHIKAVAEGDEHGNIRGNFEWISPEGKPIGVDYLADENGYQPQSDILPKPHPIPEAILKSLEYIATHSHDEYPEPHRRV